MAVPNTGVITVIIPTFNRRAFLKRAVESVLAEDRVPLVLHIFDNASTDGTEAYVRQLEAHDPRVTYVRRPDNVGSIANYQMALATIDTSYFVPLADDDWLLPDFLCDAHAILEMHPEVGAAVFVAEHRDEQDSLLGTYPTPLDQFHFGLLQPREHLTDWMRHSHYMWSSILWRQETLACVGAPYLRTGLPSDVDFQGQIFCRYPVYLVDRPGAVFLSHAAQSSIGYDVSTVSSWALLFRRLDRSVRRQKLFSKGEYRQRRQVMMDRYQGTWRIPARLEMTVARRITAAAASGFRLGDWETARSILSVSGGPGPSDHLRSLSRQVARNLVRLFRRIRSGDT